jgi:hypothetical protein
MKCDLVCNTIKHKGIIKMEYNALTFKITYRKTEYFCPLELPCYQIHSQCSEINQTS